MSSLIRPFDLLLDSNAGWRVQEAERTTVTGGSLALQTLQSLHPPLADPHGSFGGYALAQGVALWHDRLFVADPVRHRILQWLPCWSSAAPVKTIGEYGTAPRQLNTPIGLTVNDQDDLVVVDSGNRRLQLFALPGLALRQIIGPLPARPGSLPDESPEEIEETDPCVLPPTAPSPDWWRPFDVARDPKGGLFVADRRGWVWKLDARGRPDPHYDGHLPADCVPLCVEADAQGTAYLVCQESTAALPVIRMLDRYGKLIPVPGSLFDPVTNWLKLHIPDLATPAPRPATFDEESTARQALLPAALCRKMDATLKQFLLQELARRPERLSLDQLWDELRNHAYDVLLPEAYEKHLPAFLQSALSNPVDTAIQKGQLPRLRIFLEGNQVMLLPEQQETCPPAPFSTGLAVDEAGGLILSDAADGPYLIYRPPVATFPGSGYVRFQALDSGRIGNPWHRLALELQTPDRTSVRLFAFTSDVPRPDLKPVDPAAGIDLLAEPPQLGLWMDAPHNANEWLVQSLPGRYLYLVLVLKGPGDRTPQVDRVYVYAHRQSSLKFLPAIYQSEPASRNLLDRLLSMYDTIWGEIESAIEDLPRLLDPQGAPPEYLPWLASWFELILDQSWTVAQRRAFIREAGELFRWRGTLRGLRRLLQLHLGLQDPLPRILENFRSLEAAGLRKWFDLPKEIDPEAHFTILIPASAWRTPDQRRTLTRLVDAFIPAHTHYSWRVVNRGVRLGAENCRGSALGLDSILSNASVWRLPYEDKDLMPEPESVLGASLLLPATTKPQAAIRLGFTRLGVRPK